MINNEQKSIYYQKLLENQKNCDDDIESNENSEILKALMSNSTIFKKKGNRYNSSKINNKIDLSKDITKKKNKQDVIKDQLNDEFMKNCTFSPQIYSSQNNHNKKGKDVLDKNNLAQFLQKQSEFSKKVEEKIQIIKVEKNLKEELDIKNQFAASEVRNY